MGNVLISKGALGSPGYTFGRSGTVFSGTWLTTNGVPSNKAGVPLSLSNGTAVQLFIVNDRSATCTISFYHHEGDEVNLTLIETISLSSEKSEYKNIEVEIPIGKQLAARVTSGTCYNVIAGLILKGGLV